MNQNNNESAQLYAEFAKVAETQPYAWSYNKPIATADFIGTVSKINRMICFPCNGHFCLFVRRMLTLCEIYYS